MTMNIENESLLEAQRQANTCVVAPYNDYERQTALSHALHFAGMAGGLLPRDVVAAAVVFETYLREGK